MKKPFLLLATLTLPAAAFAHIDPTHPMLTGHGNVAVRPAHVIVTNQTAAQPGDTVKLDKFVVTGSLLRTPHAAAPAAHR